MGASQGNLRPLSDEKGGPLSHRHQAHSHQHECQGAAAGASNQLQYSGGGRLRQRQDEVFYQAKSDAGELLLYRLRPQGRNLPRRGRTAGSGGLRGDCVQFGGYGALRLLQPFYVPALGHRCHQAGDKSHPEHHAKEVPDNGPLLGKVRNGAAHCYHFIPHARSNRERTELCHGHVYD
ncbi:hypothetical protein SDC9_168047 [bioreactor metagenome]|uniref:Uncharacterized protein n=1 Tax=bioreactor metagenome TaxID=1076179 RepID=A0A645G1G3_9ZZZZ